METEELMEAPRDLLVPFEMYEEHAVHIGTQQKSADMLPFISQVRSDGLYILDVERTDERLRTVAGFLSRYEAKDILVVSARQYGQRPARKFAEAVGAKGIVGRFVPGTLTNARLSTYIEPRVILVTDPAADSQPLSEAVASGLPVVGICDANNTLRNVDLAMPANNKGRHSLAFIYWLLAREMLKLRGSMDDETWANLEDVLDWESSF